MTERHPNVVLITVDALRADHLSCHGYDRPTSPHLDRFAEDCARFTRAYSASSHTYEAVSSLLTGRYPEEAVDANNHLAADTVAAKLKGEEYRTGGFHSNPYVSRAYGYGDGFDEFDDDLYLGNSRIVALAQRALDRLRNRHFARADTINDRSLSWIDSLDDEPFFLWNHYMDTHGPYFPPEEYCDLFDTDPIGPKEAMQLYMKTIRNPEDVTEEERRRQIDLYDAEIRYTDDRLREFLDALRDRDLLDDTLLVLTADHGDAFGERGYYGHPRHLHDETTHVPLLLHGPDVPTTVNDTTVSTLDAVPTILDAADLDHSSLPGTPLTTLWTSDEPDHPGTAYSSAQGEDEHEGVRRFAVREDGLGYFFERNVDSQEVLGETLLERQSGEVRETRFTANSAEDEQVSSLVSKGRSHSSRILTETDSSQKETEEDQVGEEVEDRLKALGYR